MKYNLSESLKTAHGSSKDTVVYRDATPTEFGEGEYIFRDDWSVFNWAHGPFEMPDRIPEKGVAQCLVSAYIDGQLRRSGITTTCIGLIDPETGDISDRPVPTNRMAINIVRVIEPEGPGYGTDADYSAFEGDVRCAVIPIEMIGRFGLPKGSSVFKRLKKGNLDKGLFSGFELKEGVWFGVPRPDYSTKFDPSRDDIYDLGREAYMQMAGMNRAEMALADSMLREAGWIISSAYAKIGRTLWDYKVEEVFLPGTGVRMLGLGDVVGAPDEVRVLDKKGGSWSKQFGRNLYIKSQPEWVEACSLESSKGGNWQLRILDKGIAPEPMSQSELDLFSGIYTSIANAMWEENIIEGAPTIEEVQRDLERFMAQG